MHTVTYRERDRYFAGVDTKKCQTGMALLIHVRWHNQFVAYPVLSGGLLLGHEKLGNISVIQQERPQL